MKCDDPHWKQERKEKAFERKMLKLKSMRKR